MKWRSLVFLLITSLLSGCVAAIMAGTAASLIVYDRRSLRTLEHDARIFHLIRKAMVTDSRFSGSRISIVSFNEVVLLVGQTPSASLRVVAEKIAQRTPQVKRVYDEITIQNPLPIEQVAKDSLITAEIRSLMLSKRGLESGSIRIVTENATVYLLGIVSQQQANLAVDVARQAKGVQKVVKVFQYIL